MVAWKTNIDTPALHTVLIVSDSPEAAIWETLFHQRDCVVLRESTTAGALQSALVLAPSLVVLDMRLSQGERIALFKRLRAVTRGPILLLISADTVQEVMEATQSGADECLVKPVNPAVLVIKAISWLGRERAGERISERIPVQAFV